MLPDNLMNASPCFYGVVLCTVWAICNTIRIIFRGYPKEGVDLDDD